MESKTFTVLKFMLAGVVLQGLSGCESGSDVEKTAISTTSLTEIAVPDILRTVAALEADSLQLSVV